jgi:hypothetical protein
MLYCIGDSHTSYFAGEAGIQPEWPQWGRSRLPFFRAFRLGAVLAYNLPRFGTRTHGREKLLTVLRTDVPRGSRVLLCFGEIDCRAHLLRQCERQGRSPESVAAECAERYFSVAQEIQRRGYAVLLWNAIPSSAYELAGALPTYGTCLERNAITRLFNARLADLAAAGGMGFVSIFDALVDAGGLTRMEYYQDEIHLSQLSMPLTLAALERCVPGFRCPEAVPAREPGRLAKQAYYHSRRAALLLNHLGWQAQAQWGRGGVKWFSR